MIRRLPHWSTAVAVAFLAPACALAQAALAVKPLAEKTLAALPAGALYWRVETLPSLAAAQAAAGPTALAVEADGKAWLFTLGPAGGATAAATKLAEVGPIARPEAAKYLLRINDASGAPGAVTPVHSHPGSEAFYVLAGEQSIRGEHGTQRVAAGQGEPGHGAGMAMQVSSSGATNLHALVMFVVDADKPFSSPAALP